MESVVKQLQQIMKSLAPEEWRDARIYRFNDEYKMDYTLLATKVSSGQMHFYDLETGDFTPLNLSG
ncbi:MAG: hypothetical protein O2913_03430 [Chloroflexi bacterium]|nr:hypothetical protein [Chloroflexota bacterium]